MIFLFCFTIYTSSYYLAAGGEGRVSPQLLSISRPAFISYPIVTFTIYVRSNWKAITVYEVWYNMRSILCEEYSMIIHFCNPNETYSAPSRSPASPSMSSTVVELFSNRKETVPPGISFTNRTSSLAVTLSRSTPDKRVSSCVLCFSFALGCEESKSLRRMSSWISSRAEGRRQLICFHSPSAASPAFFFCRYYGGVSRHMHYGKKHLQPVRFYQLVQVSHRRLWQIQLLDRYLRRHWQSVSCCQQLPQ